MTRAGVCRFCGCSDLDPCPYGCAWVDRAETVCTWCRPAAKAEAIAVRRLAKAGYRSTLPGLKAPLDFVAAFHQGFLVGWFGLSKRSPAGRNPWPPMRKWAAKREAWTLGQRAGAETSRAYQRVCGPLMNAPRRTVLTRGIR